MDLAGFGLGEAATRPSLLWGQHAVRPRFFRHLSFAEDGGLSKVAALWTVDKWLWAALKVIFFVLNVETIVSSSMHTIKSGEPLLVERDRFLITDFLWETCVCQWLEGTGLDIKVDSGNCAYPNVAYWLAIVELSILAFMFCYALRLLTLIMCQGTDSSVHQWHYTAVLFWYLTPLIVSFSGMRALYFIAPSIFIPALGQEITKAYLRGCSQYGAPLIKFILIHAFFVWIGLDAFTVKLHLIRDALAVPGITPREHFFIVAGFVNQLLRVVQIEEFVRRRLYIFVFSGQDGSMNDEEEAARITWEAMLAKRLYHDFPLYKFLVIMLAYGDADFQQLVLEESHGRLSSVVITGSLEGFLIPEAEAAVTGSTQSSRRQPDDTDTAAAAVQLAEKQHEAV
eukprot:TRINITY_DN40406_c0_g1_i2.p1 TRINITY_DN40406_c0_g1~~TRINITY_DN40406_c0_g1_i2.p1  ORF type:complete len:397 (-),score=45.35 TRINITY_DN40406_c0_g1_i2:244-1434(-)